MPEERTIMIKWHSDFRLPVRINELGKVTDLQPAVIRYIYADHLGTPRAITNTANTVIWYWDSSSFDTAQANEDPDDNGVNVVYNLRFPGSISTKRPDCITTTPGIMIPASEHTSRVTDWDSN
jgi:hypothetical protein